MVILDEPYASELLLDWLAESGHPVLDNSFARAVSRPGRTLHLVSEAEAARRIDAGERVYANLENALSWLDDHVHNTDLLHTVRTLKDKRATRELLAPLHPELFYRSCPREALADVDAASLPYPVVLKPSIGFCSMGVRVVRNADEWQQALEEIRAEEQEWNRLYPKAVVSSAEYLVESFITGDEYAFDMYYDEHGKAHVLNVMRHDFDGPEDTSDRLYVTSSEIVDRTVDALEDWLNDVNELLGAHDFPAHVEARIHEGRITPIEFNPLRYSGFGSTDLAYHAFGVRTYAAYLEGNDIDIRTRVESQAGQTFCMSLLSGENEADLARSFDYEAFASHFSHVLEMRRFDAKSIGFFGFLFFQTDERTAHEQTWALQANLSEFLS